MKKRVGKRWIRTRNNLSNQSHRKEKGEQNGNSNHGNLVSRSHALTGRATPSHWIYRQAPLATIGKIGNADISNTFYIFHPPCTIIRYHEKVRRLYNFYASVIDDRSVGTVRFWTKRFPRWTMLIHLSLLRQTSLKNC